METSVQMNSVSHDHPVQWPILAAAIVFTLVISALAYDTAGVRHAIAALIGVVAGFSLYHASFGFSSSWRQIVTEKRGAGLRAQFWLIVLVSLFSFPLIAYGREFGFSVNGFVFPVGTGMVFGAFLFGIGMQFGGGCGSGTLFAVGGGSFRMLFTLAGFIAGSLIGTLHAPWWSNLPRFSSYSLVRELGPWTALLMLVIILAVLGALTLVLERRFHGAVDANRETGSFIRGPWSLRMGVVGLTVVCVLTLLVAGRPWGITYAYAIWGAKIATAVGVDVASWEFWRNQGGLIERSVFSHFTSVMNFGIIAGALAAAALAARVKPKIRLGALEVFTAVMGGLLMGYGARLSFGCNIGAYLGGLISGSLHGWAWMIAAFSGSTLAVLFRRRFSI